MDALLFKLVIVCPLCFFAGFVDSIAGGGGLISLPAYYAAGLDPHFVLGTNKFSSSMGTTIAAARFIKNKSFHLPSVLPSLCCALIGSTLGARLALYISEVYLRYILLIFLPALAVFLLTRKGVGDDGAEKELSLGRVIPLSILVGLVVGTYDGFFGPGTGTFLTLLYTGVIGLKLLPAMGNARIVNLASNIGALVTFLLNGKVMFSIAIPAAVCNILGSYIGSGLAIKKGSRIVKPMLVCVLILLLAKIIYDTIGSL